MLGTEDSLWQMQEHAHIYKADTEKRAACDVEVLKMQKSKVVKCSKTSTGKHNSYPSPPEQALGIHKSSAHWRPLPYADRSCMHAGMQI